MSRSYGPTTPARARGRRGRDEPEPPQRGDRSERGDRSDRGTSPRRNTSRSGGRQQRPAPLTGAERGRYIAKRTGHFLLMAAVCIVINIAAVIIIGGIAFGIYSLTK